MNKNYKKGDLNNIIKVIFGIGAFCTIILASNTGSKMSQYYGNLALYGYPVLAIIYAACLLLIISTKKVVWVWITFGWIFIKTFIEAFLFNLNFDSSKFIYSIISDVMLVIAITCLLFIKKDGKSGWNTLMNE